MKPNRARVIQPCLTIIVPCLGRRLRSLIPFYEVSKPSLYCDNWYGIPFNNTAGVSSPQLAILPLSQSPTSRHGPWMMSHRFLLISGHPLLQVTLLLDCPT